MKQKIIKYLQIAFPFLLTIALWRLSCPWVNPAGVLCIIPIFYCSFIRPVRYFSPFALLMCFLLDYKFGSNFMWTIYYCLCYMILNLQTTIDLTHTKKSGVYAFMIFFGIIILFMFLQYINLVNLLYAVVVFAITSILYIPMVVTIRAVQND